MLGFRRVTGSACGRCSGKRAAPGSAHFGRRLARRPRAGGLEAAPHRTAASSPLHGTPPPKRGQYKSEVPRAAWVSQRAGPPCALSS